MTKSQSERPPKHEALEPLQIPPNNPNIKNSVNEEPNHVLSTHRTCPPAVGWQQITGYKLQVAGVTKALMEKGKPLRVRHEMRRIAYGNCICMLKYIHTYLRCTSHVDC